MRSATDATKRYGFRFIWKKHLGVRGILMGSDTALVAATPGDESRLAILSLADGTVVWQTELPAAPVGWGLVRDADGRIFLSLDNGSVMAFEAR